MVCVVFVFIYVIRVALCLLTLVRWFVGSVGAIVAVPIHFVGDVGLADVCGVRC